MHYHEQISQECYGEDIRLEIKAQMSNLISNMQTFSESL